MLENEKIQSFFMITVLDLWWVAIWGIAYIAIDYMSGRNKKLEFLIYLFLMLFILVVLVYNPNYIPHTIVNRETASSPSKQLLML